MSGVRVVERDLHKRRRRRRGDERGRGRRDQRGIVLVYFVICLTVLMAASAFTVDVGAWYTRSGQLQRAADAAAMAGVAWMPGDFARAQQAALDTAAANGFDPSTNPNISVTVTRDPASERRLDVTIRDGKVAQYFSQAFMNGMTESRTAVGEYLAPIPLGSPENSLGNADAACGNKTCVTVPNFELSINGYCAAMEDGDPVSSRWDGTKAPYGRTFTGDPTTYAYGQTHCMPTGTTGGGYYESLNDGYNSSGYTYTVNLPGSGTVTNSYKIDVYDAAYNANGPDGIDRSLSTDLFGSAVAAHVTTNWQLLQPDNTPYDDSDNPVVASGTFADGDPGNIYTGKWATIYTVTAGSKSGDYKLRISTAPNEAASWGQNSFAIRADYHASFQPCAGTSGCAAVHATGQMSIYVDSKDTSKTATIYLAQPPSSYAGHNMEVTLFDPGEGSSTIEVDRGDGSKLPSGFTWQTTDSYSSLSGSGQTMDVSGTVTPISGRSGNSVFNDRTVMLSFPLTTTDMGKGNPAGWYKLKYTSGANNVTDRVTISVRVLASPIHLVGS